MNVIFRLDPADVILNLTSSSRDGVLAELAGRVAERNPVLCREGLFSLLLEREQLGSTGIGDGIAIPHCTSPALSAPVILFGRSDSGVDFHSVDDTPVRLFFLLVTPEGAAGIHLKLLSRISRLLKSPQVRAQLLEASSEGEISGIVMAQERSS